MLVSSISSPTSSTNSNRFYVWIGLGAILIIAIAIGGFLWLRRSAPTQLSTLPRLVTDCKFFYQVCPISVEGVATRETVQLALERMDSPLKDVKEVEYIDPADQPLPPVTPDFALNYVAVDQNINPLLLLSLSELFSRNLTDGNSVVNMPIDTESEQTGFYRQYRDLARYLKEEAVKQQLTTEFLDRPVTETRLKFFETDYALASDINQASIIVYKYIATRVKNDREFLTMVDQFPAVYVTLTGISSSSDTFVSDSRLSIEGQEQYPAPLPPDEDPFAFEGQNEQVVIGEPETEQNVEQ